MIRVRPGRKEWGTRKAEGESKEKNREEKRSKVNKALESYRTIPKCVLEGKERRQKHKETITQTNQIG